MSEHAVNLNGPTGAEPRRRPAADSVAVSCPEPGCGDLVPIAAMSLDGYLAVRSPVQHQAADVHQFCSWRCLSRYAIKAELEAVQS